ncbi:MAG: HypC/HybG/HupF family hydrogenase formation chaperone [Actinobacteria bacterium]|nr:HypC/HybG/HupF family hydrogenase formation chaperone [Actinomycetota bacterium]
MCLGVPGKILEMWDDPTGMKLGRVSFGGIVKEVCLSTTPEAEVGQYVVVHVGFAISTIDEEEAERVFGYLEEMGELAELEIAEEGEAASA